MRKLYFFGGIMMAFICIAGSIGLINNLKVQRYGSIVNMKIVEKPGSCLGTKAKWFMKVEYEGKVFPKQISGNYCENHSIGEVIQLVYLPGNTSVLFPGEPHAMEFISALLLIAFALTMFIKAFMKDGR